MTIEIDTYGFMLDTEWAYVALSWQLLITSALLITAKIVLHKPILYLA
jgi:hypothetical protein